MDFDHAVAELDALVRRLEEDGDERAFELLQLIDAMHRPALQLLLAGDSDHPVAQAVLAMYDLVEVDERLQVEAALDAVRPYIHSHGGEVEVLGVEEGVVRVRLAGACVGCAGSAMTLKRGIEQALREGFPDFRQLDAEEAAAAAPAGATIVPLTALRRPVFVEAGAVGEPGELRAVTADGVDVLLVNVQGEVFAFRNECPLDGRSLEGGRLADGRVLVCPWHNCAYDARSGARADDEPQPGLKVVPIAVEDGSVRVAVNVA